MNDVCSLFSSEAGPGGMIYFFFFLSLFVFHKKMAIEDEQHEPMLRHDDLAEQIEHMEPLAVGGM